MRSHIKLFLTIGISAIVAVALIFASLRILTSARLYIMVAPESATIEINGKEYKNGIQNLSPGNKHIKISGEGIEEYETDINCGLFSTNKLAVYLEKDGSYDSYINSKNDYRTLRLLSTKEDKKANEFIKKTEKARQLLDELPITTYYTLEPESEDIYSATLKNGDYFDTCKTAICILLDGNESQLDFIKEAVTQRGYNPDDYSYIKDIIKP